MRTLLTSCYLVLRVIICLLLALAGVQAHATQQPFSNAIAAPDQNTHYNAVVNLALERLETDNGLRVIRYGFDSINLAEVGDDIKQQEIQSAIGGAKGSIAVIYPDIGAPYQAVFAKIIEGIEAQSHVRVRSYPIRPNMDGAELNAQLKRSGAKVVIALGRQGLKTASGLDRDIPVVVGGVLSVPTADNRNLMGISLTPDPTLLFARLKNLLPNVKRVIVVYDPQHNEWLIKLAREVAKAQGLELVAQEARDLASAARLYEAAFVTADGRRDAVWLPHDATTVEEGTILPLVLKESWSRGVAFFSSSYLHVKKGALFALYPNNLELGRTLANSALGVLAGESRKPGMLPLREMHMAINLRTASHIGLNLSYQQQRSFDYIFPEP